MKEVTLGSLNHYKEGVYKEMQQKMSYMYIDKDQYETREVIVCKHRENPYLDKFVVMCR